jgi:hypothetical protein
MTMDGSFDTVAQISHVGLGYLLTTAPALLRPRLRPAAVAAVVVLFAGIKEYADGHGLQTSAVAGNSWEDFGFWCVGVALGLLVLRFRPRGSQ